MKELATATNTDNDRRALTKMFSEGIANINEIAESTCYNGKSLLNGNYSDYTVTTTKDVTTTQTVNVPVDSETARATNVMQVSENLSLATATSSATTKSAEYTTDSNGNITITSNGEFTVDNSVAGKTITVDAQNVKLSGDGEQVNVTARDKNVLTVVGENTISGSGFEAAVNIGGGYRDKLQ